MHDWFPKIPYFFYNILMARVRMLMPLAGFFRTDHDPPACQ